MMMRFLRRHCEFWMTRSWTYYKRKKWMTMMDSMTETELDETKAMPPTRILRIAKGSGHYPHEVAELLGDPTKAKEKLDWVPETSVEELAKMMVESDLELARREKTLRDAGHEIGAAHSD